MGGAAARGVGRPRPARRALRLADCEARLDRAHAHYAAAQPRDRALEDYLGPAGRHSPNKQKIAHKLS